MIKTVGDMLSTEVMEDIYFQSLLLKAEKIKANKFLSSNFDARLSKKEFIDLLKFADILSHSSSSSHKNISYKILSIAFENDEYRNIFENYSSSILIELGNFPALKFLEKNNIKSSFSPIEREIIKKAKGERQKIEGGNEILTDSQYKILSTIKDYDYFSFSGPTSLGKSFILKEYIREILKNKPDANIVILIPTRALINQTLLQYKKTFGKDFAVNISSHPVVPKFVRKKYKQHIFLFTPERLISYLSNNINPSLRFLFVDEAQKIISTKDARSSIYYHSIFEAVRKYAVSLIFSSPNVVNPDEFLRIFEVAHEGILAIQDITVAQDRYFIDLVEKRALLFTTNSVEPMVCELLKYDHLEIFKRTKDKNIIYINSASGVVDMAMELAKKIEYKLENKEVISAIETIKKEVHEEYFLIKCLEKGVAFHHGKMPHKIRLIVERLYENKEIPVNHIFCTSTLLEGVNLPAKNIFILDNTKGSNSNLDKIDFENLAGRAGRLTKEMSGNIICLRYKPEKWKKTEIIKKETPPKVESFLLNENKSRKKEFNNIGKALLGKDLSSGLSSAEREIYPHMANLLLLHEIEGASSLLTSGFVNKISDAKKNISIAKEKNKIPDYILRACSSIPLKCQNKVFDFISEEKESAVLKEDFSKENIKEILEKFYDLYNFEEYESVGINAIIPPGLIKNGYGKSHLGYWTMLLKNWIGSEPLNRLIRFSIHFYKEKGKIWIPENGHKVSVPFTGSNWQINFIIEEIMSDIEYGIRFKFERYFHNYYLILKHVIGEDVNIGRDWSDFLEYGSTNYKIIELQNVGFSRPLSRYFLEEHSDCFVFDKNILLEINEKKLKENFDKESPEYEEFQTLFFT